MMLVLDIGNTTIVAGLYKKHKRISTSFFPTRSCGTPDRLWKKISSLTDTADTAKSIKQAAIVSVVPKRTSLAVSVIKRKLHVTPVLINALLNSGLTIRYKTTVTLGADRLCNAVAAYRKYGGPVIVVDFGTATKFDVVSRKGEYLGGAIAPGLAMAAKSLSSGTALLPDFELQFPQSIVGNDTISSLQSGVMNGMTALSEGMIRKLRKEFGQTAIVIATGGFVELLRHHVKGITYVEPYLVLEGAKLIAERELSLKK